jgi:hypothetical protein
MVRWGDVTCPSSQDIGSTLRLGPFPPSSRHGWENENSRYERLEFLSRSEEKASRDRPHCPRGSHVWY